MGKTKTQTGWVRFGDGLAGLDTDSDRNILFFSSTGSVAGSALVSCEGLDGYDWSDQAEEGPNYAFMAFSSLSSDSKNEQLLKDLKKSELMVLGKFMPPKPDLSFTGLEEFVNKLVVKNCKAKSSEEEPKVVRKNDDAPIIEEWVSDDEEENVSQPKVKKKTGNPQMDLQNKGVIDSGCSRHITENMSYLTDYEEIDGGYVAFEGNPKGGKITGKDYYSRFRWVFFLATKDETSGILKSFITRIENLVDYKVKVTRCDNGTEFKNREMNQFCEMKGKGFSGRVTPLFLTMVVQHQAELGETQKPKKPKRKNTKVPQPSGSTESGADEAFHKELGDRLVRAATTASSLKAEQDNGCGPRCQEAIRDTTAQTRKVKNLERRNKSRAYKLKRLYKVGLAARVESSGDEDNLGKDTSKHKKRIDDIDQDKDITLVNDQDDAEMFDEDDLGSKEVFVAEQEVVKDVNENVVEEVVNAAQVNTAATDFTITTKEITLAQALEALKTLKPKDKGKGIMVEEPVKPKKNEQIRLDEETALRLQVEFDEEERLARNRAQKEQEANIALIETWDDVQQKTDVDYELDERLQAREQEEFTDTEKATLFLQLLEKRRRQFAVKRAEEKRNKPPTQAQQRKIMCTYLKNMEKYTLKQLKSFEFDKIKEMFDKALRRVNTFEDFRTELVQRKEKRT
nr:putative ribonuclease H-like domain-containing protein [Tanacetum cinerariifolium]